MPTTRQRRQKPVALGIGPEHSDVRGRQPIVRRDRQRNRGIDAGQLLNTDAVVDRPHGGPAIAFRKLDTHQPEVGKLGE